MIAKGDHHDITPFIVLGVDIDEWPIDEVLFIPWHAMTHVPDWKKTELLAAHHAWRDAGKADI